MVFTYNPLNGWRQYLKNEFIWHCSLTGRQPRGFTSPPLGLSGIPNILTSVPSKKEKLPLSVTHPELAKEAVGWDPAFLTAGSSKIRSWKCKLGHTWEASIAKRALRSQGCPFCSGQRLLVGFNDLSTTHPEVAKEANGWNPKEFGKGNKNSKPWICPIGHNYESTIDGRTNMNAGCPVCNGKKVLAGFNDLASHFPKIASEAYGWNPAEYTSKSNKKVEWICAMGHIYVTTIVHRTKENGSGCPYCVNQKILPGFNDLKFLFPELAKEAQGWDPSEVGAGHKRKLTWKCSEGHLYEASPSSRTERKTGCPVCAGLKVLPGINDLQTTHPELALEADGWDPSKVIAGTPKKYLWKCPNGHSFLAAVSKRSSRNHGCPKCQNYGFNPGKEAFLYFLEHPDWGMLQIGITNDIEERFAKHKRLGWQLIEYRGPMDGQLTKKWETSILGMLKAKGADLSNSEIAGKFDGYSEAWSKSKLEASSIKELMEMVERREANGK